MRAVRIVSWNIHQLAECWRELLGMEGADVALLQEAKPPPAELAGRVEVDDQPWCVAGGSARRPWRAAVARLSDRVTFRPRRVAPLCEAEGDVVGVSRPGTLAVADVGDPETGEAITVGSLYGSWEGPAGAEPGGWIYADASVHRLVSDVAALIARQRGHRILVAGDLNILRGYGENGSPYWAARYGTVFDRMEAMGLRFAGPELPNGVGPLVRPSELPPDSRTVPTYRTRLDDPATATRQLDFVFASADLLPRLRVRALNRPEEWGPSDHCRVVVDVEASAGAVVP